MAEKGHFAVDSEGQAEFQEPAPVQGPPVEKGWVVEQTDTGVKIHLDPTKPEAEQAGGYYVDPGGRVIDTQTGREVTSGAGKLEVNLKNLKRK